MTYWNWPDISGALNDVADLVASMTFDERRQLSEVNLWVEFSDDRPSRFIKSSLLDADGPKLNFVSSFREVDTQRGLLIAAGFLQDPMRSEHQLEFGRRLMELFLRRSLLHRLEEHIDPATRLFMKEYRAWFLARVEGVVDRLCHAVEKLSFDERENLASLLRVEGSPAGGRLVIILRIAFREGNGAILRQTLHRAHGGHLWVGLRFALHLLEAGPALTARETRFAAELAQLTLIRVIERRHAELQRAETAESTG